MYLGTVVLRDGEVPVEVDLLHLCFDMSFPVRMIPSLSAAGPSGVLRILRVV